MGGALIGAVAAGTIFGIEEYLEAHRTKRTEQFRERLQGDPEFRKRVVREWQSPEEVEQRYERVRKRLGLNDDPK